MKCIKHLIIAGTILILSASGIWFAFRDKCLTPKRVAASIATLIKIIPTSGDQSLVVSGINDGILTHNFNAEANTPVTSYDTPLVVTILLEGLKKLFGQTDGPSMPLPVFEVPAAAANETVTMFYSGDGGWRDLDRIIAEEMAKQGYPVVGIDALRGFWSRQTPEHAADQLAGALNYYRKAWGAKTFVLAGYSFGADILPAIYNRLPIADQDSVRLLVLLAVSQKADFEILVAGWLGKETSGLPITKELARIPPHKILCVYGQEEKSETACTDIANTKADLLELPGGHHFDEDYPKLTRLILERYRAAGIDETPVPNPQK